MGSIALVWAVLSLAVAGCNSGAVPRDLMSEEVNAEKTERPVAMKGDATFLDGKLAATATVSRGFDRGQKGGPRLTPGERRRRSAADDPYGDNGFDFFGGGDSEEAQKAAVEEYVRQAKARRAAGSPMPPVTLRVLLENRGTEPIEVEVTEVNSDLGNFAVRPPKLTLAPGEKSALEPMVSQLGVTNDEIPLKLAVRSGGKKESQVVTVRNILAPSALK